MRIFSGTLADFQQQIVTNDLFRSLESSFQRTMGRSVAPSEASSWRGSLPRLENVLRLADLPDTVHVTLEERIPYFSKRIDACLFGHDETLGSPYAVIVELKGWAQAKACIDGNVETVLGGSVREEPHPSDQVRGYHDQLEDYRRVFQGDPRVGLASCAYCHNYPGIEPDEGLFHPQFDNVRAKSPTFGERDAEILARYLSVRLQRGHGSPVLEAYDRQGIGPSKSLVDHARTMIREQTVFHLLDEQLAANNAIVRSARRAVKLGKKHVVLVRGGPGTGKSVIAFNVLGEIMRQELKVFFVSGSAAFTHGVRRILGKRLEGQVRFTDFFWNEPANSIDALIVDEAHRIREKSQPKVAGHLRPKIGQVEELIRAARTTVFFVDENQIISPAEVGEPELIRQTAERLGCRYLEFELTGQFRCNGSASYIEWLDDVLGLSPTPANLRLVAPTAFDFKLVDSPHALLDEVRQKNATKPNSARLLAGWCWKWSDPLPGGLVDDIQIGDFRFPWESKNGKRPPSGVPEAKHWAIDPAGVGQAGCVYSMQGFEMDHVGVIIGPDLVVRDGRWVADPRKNFSNGLRAKPPELAMPYLKRIYRTLLSRAMQSCTVYSVDAETRAYIASRVIRP
jgi:uncharacterized protein